MNILSWDIYEITTTESQIHGVMMRGRIRKYALEKNVTLLTENASDKDNVVRVAVLEGASIDKITNFVRSIFADAEMTLVNQGVRNPVLSKMKVNDESRYTI